MRRLMSLALLGACSAFGFAAPLAAQGALSLQGFGYPTGQLSTRAAGTAGALGETDAGSPINPAAPVSAGRSIFSFQIDPELRSITVGGRAVNTTTARFPVVIAGARLGARGFVTGSFSTLLDRTWDAVYGDTVVVGGEQARSTVSARVRGAINDAQVGFSWQFSERLNAGVGLHAYTGANRVLLQRGFDDSATFGALSQNTTLSYQGTAVSAGVALQALTHLYFAASLRVGGAMSTRYDDSLDAHGKAPSRYGAAFVYDGIPGSQIAVRYNHEQWSNMRSLGSSALAVRDIAEYAAGVDVAGPKFQTNTTQFRLGARTRDLPFGWNGNWVSETMLAGGAGVTFARGWATFDATVQRASRKGGGLKESATILSVGLTVRP